MSYKCQHSGKVIGPGIRQFRVVTERRSKQYTTISNREDEEARLSEGWEIAKELVVGPEAYEKLTGEKAGNITSKSHAVSRDAVTKEDNSRPYEPWRKRNNRSFNNTRRPQVNKVSKFQNYKD